MRKHIPGKKVNISSRRVKKKRRDLIGLHLLTSHLSEAHLDEAERVVLMHEAFDATADFLETSLVLTDPGDVLLDR